MRSRIRNTLSVVAILLASAAASGAVCSPDVFVEAPAYPAGRNPTGIAVDDFNGDTFPDVATANQNSSSVSVLLNDGAGAFGAPIETDVDDNVYSIAAADFDGDGNADLAVGGYYEVLVLLGNGDGTFAPAVSYPAGTYVIFSVAPGNLDAGGTIDLVLTSDSSAISVLLGNGDGTFDPAASYAAGGSTRSAVIGDFDGDAVADVVAANSSGNTISLLLGFGDGSFAAPLSFVAGTNPRHLVAGDFDEDGDLDVAATAGAYVSVLKGNGAGSFGAARQYSGGDVGPIVAADFTEDGHLDLALIGDFDIYYSQSDTVAVLEGDGTGAFAATGTVFQSGYSGTALATADFDGDGRTDVAVANFGTNAATILFGVGGGRFSAALRIDTPNPSRTLAEGDYNGDGIPDLAMAGNQAVSVMLGDGRGGFAESFHEVYSFQPDGVVSGDFTSDGILDLVVTSYYYGVHYLTGLGNGTFDPPVQISNNSYSYRAAVGDFNGDGDLDLAYSTECCGPGQSILFVRGNGNGTFGPELPVATSGYASAILAADLDADGDPDLAATSVSSDSVMVLLGNGDGTFQPPASHPAQDDPVSIASGDFTGDGYPDLVAANRNSQNLSLYFSIGDGTFSDGPTVAVGYAVEFVTAGDVNADSAADMLTADRNNSAVSLFPGHGAGKFGSPASYAVAPRPDFIAIADFDLSGYPDLAVSTADYPTVTILANSRLGVGTLPPAGACLGGAGVLHAFAAGYGPLAYQWRKNGVDLTDGGNVVGATTATLTIDPAGAGDEGDYDVVVTDLCTTVTSNAAPFTVSAPPAQPVILIDSPPAPGVPGIASVPSVPGNAYTWTIGGDTGAVITGGQGTAQIAFLAPVPGNLTLSVTEYSSPGCGTASAALDLPLNFFDVPDAHPFHSDIVEIARAGITAGCGGGNYCPGDPVTRAQMAPFLLKAREGSAWIPPYVGTFFTDVPPGSFAADWINYLAWQSITGGCGTNLYCPNNSVTRAQMAVFILKTLGFYYPPYTPQIFEDVPPGAFAYEFINDIYHRGITGGCSLAPPLYCPDGLVTRGQMAVFLVRAFLESAP